VRADVARSARDCLHSARSAVVGRSCRLGRSRNQARWSLEAENLVLRRQLGLFKERGAQPRRIDAATPVSLALLSRWCDWRSCLMVVCLETVVRWHRAGWRLLWRYKSRPGRPPIPLELRQLIRRMARENPLWARPNTWAITTGSEIIRAGQWADPGGAELCTRSWDGPPEAETRWDAQLLLPRSDVTGVDRIIGQYGIGRRGRSTCRPAIGFACLTSVRRGVENAHRGTPFCKRTPQSL
jgi:hypothetical protein